VTRHNGQPSRRDERSGRPKPRSHKKNTKGDHWRQAAAWAGGTSTAVLIGVLVAILSPQAKTAVSQPPSPSGTPIARSSSTAATPRGAPLSVLVERPASGTSYEFLYFFTRPIVWTSDELAGFYKQAESGKDTLPEYLTSLGGYAASPTQTELIVKNNRPYPISIIDAHYADANCTPSLPVDTVFDGIPQGGGDYLSGLWFDLDSNQSAAKSADYQGPFSSSPFFFKNGQSIPIGPTEEHTFYILADTGSKACMFHYVFTILDGTKQVYQDIWNGSTRPFRVAGGAIKDPSVYADFHDTNSEDNGYCRFINDHC
jgi:hypothetical protein